MTEIILRPAVQADIGPIEKSYSDLFTLQERTVNHTNWQRGVYPTRAVAEGALSRGELYVAEDGEGFIAGVILNSFQPEAYWEMPWEYPAAPEKVLVIHTLCLSPGRFGAGLGKKTVELIKDFARQGGFEVIRLDTYVKNFPAHALYYGRGFELTGRKKVLHEGVLPSELLYMEYKL
ncbi:MAG: GNAT family N-acetyltransferase [Oscillospiraceae bacterium]|nr:GNAT family N-acetyltransferase [Oscillospiraceae bacterium]